MKVNQLFEAASRGYLYHGSDVEGLTAILTSGQMNANKKNTDRNMSDKYSISFSRSWRYTLSGKDDDGQATDGIGKAGSLVFDADVIKQRFKIRSVSQVSDITGKFNEMRANLVAFLKSNTSATVNSRFTTTTGFTETNVEILKKAARSLGMPAFGFFNRWVLLGNQKQIELTPENKKAALDRFNQFVREANKLIPRKMNQTSEYEEVVLTDKSSIPLKNLGAVGLLLNPKLNDEQVDKFRKLARKAGLKMFQMPGSNFKSESLGQT